METEVFEVIEALEARITSLKLLVAELLTQNQKLGIDNSDSLVLDRNAVPKRFTRHQPTGDQPTEQATHPPRRQHR